MRATCQTCGSVFEATRRHARSCSPRCRAEASRRRRPESAPRPSVRFAGSGSASDTSASASSLQRAEQLVESWAAEPGSPSVGLEARAALVAAIARALDAGEALP